MRLARSAGVACTLGATLIATLIPLAALASNDGVSVQGINAGGVEGINAGGVEGINAGGVEGINAGGVEGINAGGVEGINAGGIHGINAGGVEGINAGGVEGINAGGIHGINAGGLEGINAGGVEGINAGGVEGINAGGIHGINAGGLEGINAGGVEGINAGGILGINAGGLEGINAGGVEGINAGGIHGINAGGILGINAGGVAGINAGGLLVLAGPIDSVDAVNGVFVAVGQTVMASQSMLANLNAGDFVSVNGSIVSSGWLYADSISVSGGLYVPGGREVFVTGIPSAIDTNLGQATLGELTIDYTAALSGGAIPSGLALSFSGIQPVSRGLLVSDSVSARQ